MKPCFVYLFGHQRNGGTVGPVKIGVSDDPIFDLNELSAACAYPIICICSVVAPSRLFAQTVEGVIHSDLVDYRTHGKWFEVGPLKAVEALLIAFREEFELAGFCERQFFEVAKVNGLSDVLAKYETERGRLLASEGRHE